MTQLPKSTQDFIIETITMTLGEKTHFQVILFGSYASGKQTPRSDIDIAIRCDEPLKLNLWALLDEAFENSDITQRIDLLDYHRVKSEFKKVIDQTGIVIYQN